MIRCPLCGSDSRVRFTRDRANGGETYRKRDCENEQCGNEFSSVEYILGARGTDLAISVPTLINLAEELGIPVDRNELPDQNSHRAFITGERNQ